VDWNGDKLRLRLAHFSVKEYLVSDRIRSSRARMYAVIKSDAHDLIAQTCLAYLLQIETDASQNETDASPIETYPFVSYAGCYWSDHVGHQGGAFSDNLQALMLELFKISETQSVSCTSPENAYHGYSSWYV
jgi:hypothetical protein